MISVSITHSDTPPRISSVLATGIVAQPGGQSNATPLAARINIVANVVPGAAVLLQVGPWPDQKVFNRCGTGQALLVDPPFGTQIEGYGVNVPVQIDDGGNSTFTFDGVRTWLVS